MALAGCELIQGLLGGGVIIISGTIRFDDASRLTNGTLYTQILSVVNGRSGTVETAQTRPFNGEAEVSFELEIDEAGLYNVTAFIDANQNGSWDADEPGGQYPTDPSGNPILTQIQNDVVDLNIDVALGSGGVPPAPTGLSVGNATDTTLDVSWNAVPGATSYQLFAMSCRAVPFHCK